MPFIKKRVKPEGQGFGDDLRELRELRGYTQKELGRLSGIHPTVIAALEEERLGDIADPAYAERHIRTLARVLEGRADFFLSKYRQLLLEWGVSDQSAVLLRERVRRRDFFVTSRLFVFLGFFAMVAAVAAYVIWQAALVSSAPELTLTAPVEGQRVASSRIEVRGQTDPSASVTVNGGKAIVDRDGSFAGLLDIPRGFSTLRVEARRRYSGSTVIERHVYYERASTVPAATGTTP